LPLAGIACHGLIA